MKSLAALLFHPSTAAQKLDRVHESKPDGSFAQLLQGSLADSHQDSRPHLASPGLVELPSSERVTNPPVAQGIDGGPTEDRLGPERPAALRRGRGKSEIPMDATTLGSESHGGNKNPNPGLPKLPVTNRGYQSTSPQQANPSHPMRKRATEATPSPQTLPSPVSTQPSPSGKRSTELTAAEPAAVQGSGPMPLAKARRPVDSRTTEPSSETTMASPTSTTHQIPASPGVLAARTPQPRWASEKGGPVFPSGVREMGTAEPVEGEMPVTSSEPSWLVLPPEANTLPITQTDAPEPVSPAGDTGKDAFPVVPTPSDADEPAPLAACGPEPTMPTLAHAKVVVQPSLPKNDPVLAPLPTTDLQISREPQTAAPIDSGVILPVTESPNSPATVVPLPASPPSDGLRVAHEGEGAPEASLPFVPPTPARPSAPAVADHGKVPVWARTVPLPTSEPQAQPLAVAEPPVSDAKPWPSTSATPPEVIPSPKLVGDTLGKADRRKSETPPSARTIQETPARTLVAESTSPLDQSFSHPKVPDPSHPEGSAPAKLAATAPPARPRGPEQTETTQPISAHTVLPSQPENRASLLVEKNTPAGAPPASPLFQSPAQPEAVAAESPPPLPKTTPRHRPAGHQAPGSLHANLHRAHSESATAAPGKLDSPAPAPQVEESPVSSSTKSDADPTAPSSAPRDLPLAPVESRPVVAPPVAITTHAPADQNTPRSEAPVPGIAPVALGPAGLPAPTLPSPDTRATPALSSPEATRPHPIPWAPQEAPAQAPGLPDPLRAPQSAPARPAVSRAADDKQDLEGAPSPASLHTPPALSNDRLPEVPTPLPPSQAAANDPSVLAPAPASPPAGHAPPVEVRHPHLPTHLAGTLAAQRDDGLAMTVMPHSAHMSIESSDGDLALHLRVRHGSADVTVAGSMAPLFEARAPEARAALAGEGLNLGRFDLGQQGGGGQQGQPAPERPEHVPEPATPYRHQSNHSEPTPNDGRIHVTA